MAAMARIRTAYRLPVMTPRQQLQAGKLPHRLLQLFVGLVLYGFSMAMMLRATLGLDPWDVLHQGLTRFVPLTFGQVTIVVGAMVLLLWIPLKQWPGFGTVANVIVIGLAADLALWLLPTPETLWIRIPLMIAGVLANGLAGAIYIGSNLGPGPRDGLMTGLAERSGRSLRLVRTSIEVTVLVGGWLLGGTFGVGTILYALGIGPLIQFFLPYVAVRVRPPGTGEQSDCGTGDRGGAEGH